MSSVLRSSEVTNVSLVDSGEAANSLDSLPTDEFLKIVGMRVRAQRSANSMSRKKLAEVSGVSERYLAQLESGQGNMSIALLRKVTTAVNLSLAKLLSAETPELHESLGTSDVPGISGENRHVGNSFSRDKAVDSNRHMIAGL